MLVTLELENGQQMLRLSIDNAVPAGHSGLTSEQCTAAFETGSKGPGATTGSDGIGLGTVATAAKAAGGRATLRYYVDGADQTHVVFCLVLPATRTKSNTARGGNDEPPVAASFSSCHSSTTSTPSETRFSESFRSTVAPLPRPRRLEGFTLLARGADSGSNEEAGIVCVGCDDSQLMRPLIRYAFEALGASKATVVGANAAEISSVIDIALGMGVEDGSRADLVLLDVNLDVDDKPYARGDAMATTLRRQGFEGFIALYTAGTNGDLQMLMNCRDANCVIMKDIRGPPLHERLREEYLQFTRSPGVGTQLPSASSPVA